MNAYSAFLEQKQSFGANSGFKPLSISSKLFDFQAYLTDWAICKGRGAVFADCGLGKTAIQLSWADNVLRHLNKPVLVITPLAVGRQTLHEAEKFEIDARIAVPGSTPGKTIHITNYEKLHRFNAADYGGVVCDESSILKNFNGVRKAEITEFMRISPYRLLCTATAAPNDWPELGTSSEALGYFGYMDMLGKFFTTKGGAISSRQNRHRHDKFTLREYAKQDFWRWVGSWARVARRPGDLGFSDNGFILPKLIENDIEVKAERPPDGMLFELQAVDFFEEREAIRRTITERCEMAAKRVEDHDISIIWCNLNDEAKLLKQIIPNSVEVSGNDSEEKKEEAANWFVNGTEIQRRLVSKADIFGFGMNFQHCAHNTYFPTHSYERYYQATRRVWRFGQTQDVVIDRIYTNGGRRILDNLDRKSSQAAQMFENLVKYVNDELEMKNTYTPRKVGLPQWLTK